MPGRWSRYNPDNGTDECQLCPGGYSCETEATFDPLPCPPGRYREVNTTVACQECPEGSWNPFWANPLADLCLSCPEGRVCPLKGMTNVTSQSTACPEGYICPQNTSSSLKFNTPCPPGHWCATEAKPWHMECVVPDAVALERSVIALEMTSVADPVCPCLETCGTIPRDDERMCFWCTHASR